MDMYRFSTPDFFRIDDLLDFSNDELFSSSTSSYSTTADSHHHHHLAPPENPSNHLSSAPINHTQYSTAFTDNLCVPTDDVAELEWLSQFVDDSFTDFPENSLDGTLTVRPDTSFSGRPRTKRSRATPSPTWTSSPETQTPATGKLKPKKETPTTGDRSSSPEGGVRRCSHCASEKTPQWRTGPLGPKTLCNACGVRYKSGRLVPEYRPAASPTFLLTQHSNSHRKVLELRRQKEMSRQQQEQVYRHQHDFEVC